MQAFAVGAQVITSKEPEGPSATSSRTQMTLKEYKERKLKENRQQDQHAWIHGPGHGVASALNNAFCDNDRAGRLDPGALSSSPVSGPEAEPALGGAPSSLPSKIPHDQAHVGGRNTNDNKVKSLFNFGPVLPSIFSPPFEDEERTEKVAAVELPELMVAHHVEDEGEKEK